MGLVCGVAFMGAPIIVIEKLVGGDETLLALTRLQQVLASGVCGGGDHGNNGRTGNERVRVREETCTYFDGSSFPMYLADEDDLKKIDVASSDIPLVQYNHYMFGSMPIVPVRVNPLFKMVNL